MKPRRVLVRVHRWLSIALVLWLVVVGLTGAYLAEGHAIEAFTHAERYQHGEGDLGAQAALDAAAAAAPEDATISYLVLPGNGRGVYQATVEVPDHDAPPPAEGEEPAHRHYEYYVDPATATVNGTSRLFEDSTLWWMYRGHMYLWQDHGLFGADDPDGGMCVPDPDGLKGFVCAVIPSGLNLVGWFGVAWMAVLLTGVYLWFWPGVRRWATALRVRTTRGRFTFSLDLHKAIGVVFWVPLVVVAFTGMAFCFENMKGWYENVTPAVRGSELWVPPEDLASAEPAGRDALDADEALAAVGEAFPQRTVISVAWFPTTETDTYQFWVDRGFSPWTREAGGGNTLVAIDQYSGDVLYDGTPEDGNVFDQAWQDWGYPLHTGDFGGNLTRVVWVLVGLSPLGLTLTGVSMNLLRRRKRRRHLERAAPNRGRADRRV
jgi:uncharacterized iron-regulated membrane protein